MENFMFLGNILTKEKFDDTILYNVVNNKEEIIENLPTLIIGWELTKELYPTASIIDWKIDENTYWTFGKRVRRESNEKAIKNFKELALKRAVDSVNYTFFNVLTTDETEKTDFFKFMKDDREKFSLFSNDMAYIYCPSSSTVTGISLTNIDYEGGNKEKFVKILKNNKNNTIVKERDYISYETRKLIENKRYIIPYLCSLKA